MEREETMNYDIQISIPEGNNLLILMPSSCSQLTQLHSTEMKFMQWFILLIASFFPASGDQESYKMESSQLQEHFHQVTLFRWQKFPIFLWVSQEMTEVADKLDLLNHIHEKFWENI